MQLYYSLDDGKPYTVALARMGLVNLVKFPEDLILKLCRYLYSRVSDRNQYAVFGLSDADIE